MRSSDHLITVTVERPAYGGHAIARVEGKVLFVGNAIPGETVVARIDEEKRDYALATAVRIIGPSPDRVTPFCSVFGICGGCQLQYVAYPRQVSLKEEVLRDTLRRTAGIEPVLGPSLFMDAPWNYRHRGQFKLGGGLLGLYREQSHHVVEFKQCPLMTDRVNAAFQRVQKSVREHPALVAGIEEIHLSSSESDSALIRTRHGFNAVRTKQVIELFTSLHFEDISIEVPGHRSCRTFTKVMKLDLNGISYGIAPDTFFQSHWMLNRIVVRHVVERLGSLKGKRVVDLYSGAGNFSLPLARTAAEVIAVEEHSAAIANGIRNARLNELENCRFIQSSAERLQVKDKIDVLVVDPPRLGISGAAMNKILTLAPRRIVSLSCNPSTFARDVKKLLEKYSIESIQLVDFFPQTYHIETLAFLKRK